MTDLFQGLEVPPWETEAWDRLEKVVVTMLEHNAFIQDLERGFWIVYHGYQFPPCAMFEPDYEDSRIFNHYLTLGYIDTGRIKHARFDGSTANMNRVLAASGRVLHRTP